jgi:hypothetical protein
MEHMGELSGIREVPHLHLVRVGNKKPTKKNHLKNPLKMCVFLFFYGFFNFQFFMKIIPTFLFETDFL